MEKLESGKVYSGSKEFYIPKGKRFRIEASKPFELTGINEDGEITKVYASGHTVISNISNGLMSIKLDAGQMFTVDYQQDNRDPADPVPVELGVPEPKSLRERIQETIRELLHNEFGTQSKEVETWEEAQDFLMNDTDGLMSPYEMLEMIPEPEPEPIIEPAAPAADNPQPVDSSPEPA